MHFVFSYSSLIYSFSIALLLYAIEYQFSNSNYVISGMTI